MFSYILMVLIPSMVLSGGAAWLVKSRFAKYSRIPSTRGYTGQMAAQKLLDYAGIHDVQVVRVDGMLTDHYNPATNSWRCHRPSSIGPRWPPLVWPLTKQVMRFSMRRATIR